MEKTEIEKKIQLFPNPAFLTGYPDSNYKAFNLPKPSQLYRCIVLKIVYTSPSSLRHLSVISLTESHI
jgi:hypothetical protein